MRESLQTEATIDMNVHDEWSMNKYSNLGKLVKRSYYRKHIKSSHIKGRSFPNRQCTRVDGIYLGSKGSEAKNGGTFDGSGHQKQKRQILLFLNCGVQLEILSARHKCKREIAEIIHQCYPKTVQVDLKLAVFKSLRKKVNGEEGGGVVCI